MENGTKGLFAQINEINYDGNNLTNEDLEKAWESLSSASKSREFVAYDYCSTEQYQELRTVSDSFDRAMMKGVGCSELDVLNLDIRKFVSRNANLPKDLEDEYRRCKLGYDGMTGEEYFFLNYCKVNGRLPVVYSAEIFKRYQSNVLLKLRLLEKRRVLGSEDDFVLRHPKSVEQCFRVKNKLK